MQKENLQQQKKSHKFWREGERKWEIKRGSFRIDLQRKTNKLVAKEWNYFDFFPWTNTSKKLQKCSVILGPWEVQKPGALQNQWGLPDDFS
jgi:hypothetical protein